MRTILAGLLLVSWLGCSGDDAWVEPPPLPEAWRQDAESTFFLQMSDTQFGLWSTPLVLAYLGRSWNQGSFARESENMERAIAHANRLAPRFVVICGDLVNEPGHAGQIAEFRRIAGQLDPAIRLYLVAGNHDVGSVPTPATLAAYRETFGPDWYAFREGVVYGIVLNSQLLHSPQGAPAEAEAQLAWLRAELPKARASGAAHVLVFQHHPYFAEAPDEEDGYFNIPLERRRTFLALLREGGVRAVLAGHLHHNAHGFDGPLEMVTTGPVGRPLGEDPSGFRIVRVGPAGLDHAYVSLESVPERLGAP